MRLPCGGGLTMGAFHSGEFEGLWSRFPGLKLLYPATAQETFEALVAGFYDPNPCLVFEHKLLYWSKAGEIDFDGNLEAVWRPRRYTEGTDLTLVAFGAMVHEALAAAARSPRSIEVWNPFVLQPMDLGPILESVCKTGRLLVVQECGAMQGLGDRVISRVCREALGALKCPPQLVAAPDVPVPFAPELESYCRPNSQRIEAVVDQMVREGLMDTALFKMPLYLPAQGAHGDRGHDHRVARGRGRPLPQGAGAGAGRQREVGVRFRGPLRRPGDPPLSPRRRDPAADRADHGDRDRRSGDARLDSAGRGRRAPAVRVEAGRGAARDEPPGPSRSCFWASAAICPSAS